MEQDYLKKALKDIDKMAVASFKESDDLAKAQPISEFRYVEGINADKNMNTELYRLTVIDDPEPRGYYNPSKIEARMKILLHFQTNSMNELIKFWKENFPRFEGYQYYIFYTDKCILSGAYDAEDLSYLETYWMEDDIW